MKFTFKKNERLCKLSDFKILFTEGKTVTYHSLKSHYIFLESYNPIVKVAFSVSSKKIKRATKRNYIKRLMREAYRKNKHILWQHIHKNTIFIVFVYTSDKKITYNEMEKFLCLTLQHIKDENLQFHQTV